jgi:hypothetical protein
MVGGCVTAASFPARKLRPPRRLVEGGAPAGLLYGGLHGRPPFNAPDLKITKQRTFDTWRLSLYLEVLNVYDGKSPEDVTLGGLPRARLRARAAAVSAVGAARRFLKERT